MMLDDSDFVVSLLFFFVWFTARFSIAIIYQTLMKSQRQAVVFWGGGAKAAEERARCGLIVWREEERKKENNIPVMVK